MSEEAPSKRPKSEIAAVDMDESSDLESGDEDMPSAKMDGRSKGLSAEAQAIIAAINGGPIASGLKKVKRTVSTLTASVQSQGSRLSSLESRMDAMELNRSAPPSEAGSDRSLPRIIGSGGSSTGGTGGGGGGGGGGGVGFSNPYQDDTAEKNWPFNRRRTLVCGGWPRDTETSLIVRDLEAAFRDANGVLSKTSGGRYNIIGKVKFRDPTCMWVWLKAHKGQKLSLSEAPHVGVEIWFSVEKSDMEQAISSRVTKAVDKLLEVLKKDHKIPEAHQRNTEHLPCDFLRGIVWWKPDVMSTTKFRILDRHRDDINLRVAEDFEAANLPITKAELLDAVNTAVR